MLHTVSEVKDQSLCWAFLEVQVQDFQCHMALKNLTAVQGAGQ